MLWLIIMPDWLIIRQENMTNHWTTIKKAMALKPNKESYDTFIKFAPKQKNPSDQENVRDKIIQLFKENMQTWTLKSRSYLKDMVLIHPRQSPQRQYIQLFGAERSINPRFF